MPPSRQPSDPSEIRLLRVIMENVRSDVRQLADGLGQFREQTQREFAQLRSEMNERFALVEQALKEHTRQIQENTRVIEQMRQNLSGLTERFDEHQKAHAT